MGRLLGRAHRQFKGCIALPRDHLVASRRRRIADGAGVGACPSERRVDALLADFLVTPGLLLLLQPAINLAFILQLYQLQHAVVPLDGLQLRLELLELLTLLARHGVLLELALFHFHQPLDLVSTQVHGLHPFLLLINFALPVSSDLNLLLLLIAQCLVEGKQVFVHLALLRSHVGKVGLNS